MVEEQLKKILQFEDIRSSVNGLKLASMPLKIAVGEIGS